MSNDEPDPIITFTLFMIWNILDLWSPGPCRDHRNCEVTFSFNSRANNIDIMDFLLILFFRSSRSGWNLQRTIDQISSLTHSNTALNCRISSSPDLCPNALIGCLAISIYKPFNYLCGLFYCILSYISLHLLLEDSRSKNVVSLVA